MTEPAASASAMESIRSLSDEDLYKLKLANSVLELFGNQSLTDEVKALLEQELDTRIKAHPDRWSKLKSMLKGGA
jgi:hypothetical protein